MTEQSDGVTDARIQAAKVIAGFLKSYLKGAQKKQTRVTVMSPEQSESLRRVGERKIREAM